MTITRLILPGLVLLFTIAAAPMLADEQPAMDNQQPATSNQQPQNYAVEHFRQVNQSDEIVTTLRNGMTVITRRVPSPVMTVRGYIFTGGIYEGRWLGGGMSHLLEHLVAGGATESRTELENRTLRQQIGNTSNAYTTLDHTGYFINTTPEHLDTAADLLLGWLLEAKITPEEYDREYEVVQRELEMGRGDPQRQFWYLQNINRYRVHPARVPVIGIQEVIQGLTRDDVYEYYQLTYHPNNMLIVIAGDEDPEVMLAAVQRQVDDKPPGRVFTRQVPEEPPVTAPRTLVATFPQLGQARVGLNFPTFKLQHEDLYAVDLLAAALGQGESSLLVERIRDEQRLVSSITSFNWTPHFADGTFMIIFQADAERIPEATEAILQLLARVAEEGIDEQRLQRAKTQIRISDVRGRQTAARIADGVARDFMATGDPHYSARYIQRIQEVTPEQVQAMAGKYFNTEVLMTTALVPAEWAGADGLPRAEDLLRQAAPTTEDPPAEETEVTRIILDNGTILLHRRITTTPLVTLNMYAYGGLTIEDDQTNGIGNFAMEMLPRGTENRSARQIAEFFDSIGATLGTGMGNNTWFWTASALNDDIEDAFAAWADVIRNPTFPGEETDAMRQRILARIAQQDANWQQQAFRFHRERFFGPQQSPYRFQQIGLAENVQQLTPDQLGEWYRQQVLTAPRVLAIFGDIDLEQAEALARRHLADLPEVSPEREAPRFEPLPEQIPDKPAVEVVRVEVQQTSHPLAGVVIGFESDSVIGDPANFPILVADTMTSGYGYPTGYLHEILRGRGLVYVVHAFNSPGVSAELPGAFVVYAGCEPQHVNEVIEVILQSIARVQGTEEDFQEGWFERSRELLVVNEAMSNETAADQAAQAALNELYGLGFDYHERFAENVDAVEIPRMRAVAAQRLRRAVVTVSTPRPDDVQVELGERQYDEFPPVDLTPRAIQHDMPAGP